MPTSELSGLTNTLKLGLLDVCVCFGIRENLFEKYVVGEILSNKTLVNFSQRRHQIVDHIKSTPLGGPGTALNAVVLYCLVRHFNMKFVVETGVSGGYYTGFLIAAMQKNKGKLLSIEISDDIAEVAKLIPSSLYEYEDWVLMLGTDAINALKKDWQADMYCHDSLHTFDHMTQELKQFLNCRKDNFFLYFDDQDSEDFWKKSLANNAFKKDNYRLRAVSGNESRLRGHLGGFLRYDKL